MIDYYLDLLPGVIPSHARQRLFLPSPMDGSVRPLSEKSLERPRLMEHIRSLINSHEDARAMYARAVAVLDAETRLDATE
jgi:hypothetical protein